MRRTGATAWHELKAGGWDLIVLDWWLPGEEGVTLLQRFRQFDRQTPVLFLTARDAVSDRVRGLNAGRRRLSAQAIRVRGAAGPDPGPGPSPGCRRGHDADYRDVRVDLATQRAEPGGHPLHLTAKEQSLLVFFLRHAGEVLSRTRIYEHVWDERYDGLSNTLEVHVKELRRKLEFHGPRLIHTLRGRGYLLGDSPERNRWRNDEPCDPAERFLPRGVGPGPGRVLGDPLPPGPNAPPAGPRRAPGRLLDALCALVRKESDRVEWKPGERPDIAGLHPLDEPVRWAVFDVYGRSLDHSWDIQPQDLTAVSSLSPDAGHVHDEFTDQSGRQWRLVVRRIKSRAAQRDKADRDDDREDDSLAQGDLNAPRSKKSSSLVVASGTLTEPMEASLRGVALTLVGLSTVIWLVAALVGRGFCRRALLPVTRMAQTACSMNALSDRDQRLPVPGTGDELDGLARSFNGLLGLHEALERQCRFTGDASHQLRTPLTAALGQIEVALRRDRTADDIVAILEDVHGEAVRLQQIVEALLFMARAETETARPELQRLELASWTRDHLRGWSAHEGAVDLRDDLELGEPAWVRVHPHLLGQLLDNLLENARKYGAPGTPIHVGLERDGDRIALAVQDQGPGLPPEELPHIFEPFYRTAEARRLGQSGVGLGLAIVRRIADVLGGRVDVSSEPGRGSRFVLHLPIATGEMAPPSQARPCMEFSPVRV